MTSAEGHPGLSDLLLVGRITKAHGLRGEVVVYLISDRVERLAKGSGLHHSAGRLTVSYSKPHQDRWIVKFDSVDSRETAEQLRGTELFAEPLPNDGMLWVHELIGREVQTLDGVSRGRVESVMENPAADLLVLESGALVPVVFIVSDPDDEPIQVDTPDGLFDLGS